MSPALPPMQIESFFDPATWTVTYLVHQGAGSACAIIDSVLDYDPKSGRTRHTTADRVVDRVKALKLKLEWILETHAHADHVSAAAYIKSQLGGRIGIGEHITQVQQVFKGVFNLDDSFVSDGSQFDHLFAHEDGFELGTLRVKVLWVPGHTPADVAYLVEDGVSESAVFVGDTLFMPDVGTARCDFPGGNAQVMYASIRRLLSLPPATRLFMCHDYPPTDRPIAFETTVAEQRARNIHANDQIDEAAFVALRTERDRTLEMPVLILPAIQINIRAGYLPPPESNGVAYAKIPLNFFNP